MSDFREVLDAVAAVRAALPQAVVVPPTTTTPPGTETPVPVPGFTTIMPDLTEIPDVLKSPDGAGYRIDAIVGSLWGAVWQVLNQEIRTVAGGVTIADNRIWAAGTQVDIPITWTSTPLDAVQGAIPGLDVGVAWQGRVTATIVDGSITATGVTARVTNVSATSVVPTAASPITVRATGIYLYSPPYVPPP